MTFRNKSIPGLLDTLRFKLNNYALYDELHQLATRVMCDVYDLTIENCHNIPPEAIHYRDNLTAALINIWISHQQKK